MPRMIHPDDYRRLRAARERLERAIAFSEVARREQGGINSDLARRSRDYATNELVQAARILSGLLAKELGY